MSKNFKKGFPLKEWRLDQYKILIFEIKLKNRIIIKAFPELKNDTYRWRNVESDTPVNPNHVIGWRNFCKIHYVIWENDIQGWKICSQ